MTTLSTASGLDAYPFEVRPLAAHEGEGFLIAYVDFPGRVADGDTIDKAKMRGHQSLAITIETLKTRGVPVPTPNSGGVASGKFAVRVPKAVHAELAMRAKIEGVSLNMLVLTFIAEGLGRREHAH